MQAEQTAACISILLAQDTTERQDMFFNQLLQVKNLLRNALQEDWQWEQRVQDENNKTVSHIYTSLDGVNIYRKEDWPAMISFFKTRITMLDAFWTEVKDGFIYL